MHKITKHFHRSVKKKFACTDCDYSTDLKSVFKRHSVTHTGVKAHKCDTGGNCFTLKSGLTRHIKSITLKRVNMNVIL